MMTSTKQILDFFYQILPIMILKNRGLREFQRNRDKFLFVSMNVWREWANSRKLKTRNAFGKFQDCASGFRCCTERRI